MKLEVRSPYSGKKLLTLKTLEDSEVRAALERSQEAFEFWKDVPVHQRGALLTRAAGLLKKQRHEFEHLIMLEAGKPVKMARIELDRAIDLLNWAAGEALRPSDELLRQDSLPGSKRQGLLIHTRFPRGVVLGITPFNFPLNLVLHKVAPALACGSSVLIKPSPYTPLTALKLAELFAEAASCEEEKFLVQTLIVTDEQTKRLSRHHSIPTVSFTGSEAIGKLVQKQAVGKHVTLELGGNAWAIVHQDAEGLDTIAQKLANSAFAYAGQSCISVQNIAVHESVADLFEELLCNHVENYKFGDPTSEEVLCGPVINEKAAIRISKLLNSAQKQTRQVASRSRVGGSKKTLISPTLVIWEELGPKMLSHPLVAQEAFGPVVNLVRYSKIDQLIDAINGSAYGLQTGVFTRDLPLTMRLYRQLSVGGVVLNDPPSVRFDHQPYGGQKDSGFGREGIRSAMDEMTDSKTLVL